MIGYKYSVYVSEYCYNCLINGSPQRKTLIIMPNKLASRGIITINKPIVDVTIPDIIMNYKRFKQAI